MSTQPRPTTSLISTHIDSPHSVREIPVGSRDAARLLRMHPKTVLRKAREGTLPAHPVGTDRKRWLFRWRERCSDGTLRERNKVIGTVEEYPTKSRTRQ